MAQENQWFLSHGSAKAYLHIVVFSLKQGLQSTPLKWSKDQTWVPRFLPYHNPVCEESPQIRVTQSLTQRS
jgi:hypothetical protein